MNRILEWEDVVEEIDGIKKVKKNVKLNIDCIYKNKSYAQNYNNDVFVVLIPGVGNSGGFRYNGSVKNFNVKYVVLYSTNKDIYWQDKLDEELGMYIYFGDNKKPGMDLHEQRGNKILKKTFELASSENLEERKQIPPFFLFERDDIGGVKFRGLLVPGYPTIDEREWLVALWAKLDEGGRFQNYKSIFTLLDTSTGSNSSPNDAGIDLRWLDDLKNGKGFDSLYAPLAWKEWVKNKKKYTPLITKRRARTRSREEQLPKEGSIKYKMLEFIHEYYKKKPTAFEPFALWISTIADDNILETPFHTRNVRDGGRDGIGEYIIMKKLNAPLTTTFAIEAKCYSLTDGVGVKETSRLISRIRYRQFGILVTTSFVSKQAYDEIIEDEHPIAIISGIDIIDILFQNQITDVEKLKKYLNNHFSIVS